MSRALTTLITLKYMIRLTNTHFHRPSGVMITRCLGPLQSYKIQAMTTVSDEELNDPKRHLDYKEFVERKSKENVVVIDVREHSEVQETGKIPGSIHIPLNDLAAAFMMSDEEFFKSFGSCKPKPCDEIIFSCKAGRRSLTAMKHALEAVPELRRALSEMPEEEFKKNYSAPKPPKDAELIFSCKLGGRSLKALKLALELGFKNAKNFKGGWLDWEKNTRSSS